jgi:hypothetical protein
VRLTRAVIALYAAALRPEAVRSLTVSEPGCLRVAAGDPRVDAQIAGGEYLFQRASTLTPLEFLRAFRGGAGSTNETPEELTGELLHGVRLLMRERPPWEADPPLDALSATGFPKLVISGGHSPVFEAVCDVIATRLHAERATIPGRAHTIPATGEAYNDRFARVPIQERADVSGRLLGPGEAGVHRRWLWPNRTPLSCLLSRPQRALCRAPAGTLACPRPEQQASGARGRVSLSLRAAGEHTCV